MIAMTDVHAHVLPGMDDGAKNTAESLRMLSAAYGQGVRLCAATPHLVLHRSEAIGAFLKKRHESMQRLSDAAKKSDMHIPELVLGAEIFLDNNINAYPDMDKLCIGDSPYILLEFPTTRYNPYWGDWLQSMCIRGLRPIVAHVERYAHFEKMLADFLGLDITYQINASTLLSMRGRRFAAHFLKNHAPCVIASDMHNMTTRACRMEDAFHKAQRICPQDAQTLFSLQLK